MRTGWDGLSAGQRELPRRRSGTAPTSRSTGDPELQQAVRFALFHVVQAGARAEQRAIPAKGLTGRGYDGHTFWDMETYTLPVLTYTAPETRPATRCSGATRRWTSPRERARSSARGRRLPVAHDPRARSARATGRRARRPSTSTPTSPTPCAATCTRPATRSSSAGPGSTCWSRPRACGARSATTTPRAASASTASPGPTSTRRSPTTTSSRTSWPRGTCATRPTSPRATRGAPSELERRRGGDRGAGATRPTPWSSPSTTSCGVTPQSEGFTRYRPGTSRRTPRRRVPAAAALPVLPAVLEPGRQAGRSRLRPLRVRRPLRRRAEARATSPTTSAITVRDSSLSASHPGRSSPPRSVSSTSPTTTSARRRSSTCATWPATRRDGIHLASLAGAWLVAVAGFGGMRDHGEHAGLRAAAAARGSTRLAFRSLYRGRRLRVDVAAATTADYELLDGEPLELVHHGEPFTLGQGVAGQPPVLGWSARRGPSRRPAAGRHGATRRRSRAGAGHEGTDERDGGSAGRSAGGVGAGAARRPPGSRRRRPRPSRPRSSTRACAGGLARRRPRPDLRRAAAAPAASTGGPRPRVEREQGAHRAACTATTGRARWPACWPRITRSSWRGGTGSAWSRCGAATTTAPPATTRCVPRARA